MDLKKKVEYKKYKLEDDLVKIENKMKEIVDRNEITKREVWDRNKAISHFKKKDLGRMK